MDLILRFSCVKAFTPVPPLTPVPCRSDVMVATRLMQCQGGTKHLLGAQGQAKTRPNLEVLMAG